MAASGSVGRGEEKRAPVSARLLALAKDALFFIYLYCGYVQLRDLALSILGRSRATVLYYHRIGGRDVLTKPADGFAGELQYLKSNYECVSFFDLCERLRAGEPLRRRLVAITFDDGYRDNFTEAVPALARAGVTATFFVSTGYIGTDRDFPHDLRATGKASADSLPKLTWDDLRQMQSLGFEIGSHTINHTSLGRADHLTVEQEVNDSLATLDRELGHRPRAFSFPWGKPEDISDQAVRMIRGAGYYAAASAYGGANTRGSDLFNVRRLDVGNGHLSRLAFRARIAGLDPDFLRLKLRKWSI
jgi:peptidoglycan/xylan/chitin deacetylase (PgdA/CDA1 family)